MHQSTGQHAPPTQPDLPPGLWKRCLLGGLLLWALAILVTYTTQNTTLLPLLILLGSFLVPGCFALWAYEKYGRDLGLYLIVSCFAVGGVLGVLGASVLEYYLLSPSVWLYLGVGLIEEAVKAAALIFLLQAFPQIRGLRAGIVLGASVGFGFAAVESAGYAFNALFTFQGTSLRGLVETEMLRGLLAPFGHGLWTAILGAFLLKFRENGRFHFPMPVVVAYLGVAALHALWDSTRQIAIAMVYAFTGNDTQRAVWELGFVPQPTTAQQHLFSLFSIGGLVVISLIGLAWLRSLAMEARREETPSGDPGMTSAAGPPAG